MHTCIDSALGFIQNPFMWQRWLSTFLLSSSSTTKMELALRQPSAATSTGLTPNRRRTATRSSCVMPMSSVILSAGLCCRCSAEARLVALCFANRCIQAISHRISNLCFTCVIVLSLKKLFHLMTCKWIYKETCFSAGFLLRVQEDFTASWGK